MALGTARLHLIVTDVVMPGMSGTTFARQLAQERPEVQVLFVSGYSREAIADRGLGEAGLYFLPKPFTASALLERVRQVLDAAGGQLGEPGPRSGSTRGEPS
jgi:DNA-binding response OmpR family regulator